MRSYQLIQSYYKIMILQANLSRYHSILRINRRRRVPNYYAMSIIFDAFKECIQFTQFFDEMIYGFECLYFILYNHFVTFYDQTTESCLCWRSFNLLRFITIFVMLSLWLVSNSEKISKE